MNSLDQPSIVGTYVVKSFIVVIDGVPTATLGKAHGYVIFTPTHFSSFITSDQRIFGTTVEAKAALWDSLIAYAGPYKANGEKLTVDVDVSMNESWNGTAQVRAFELIGRTLNLTTMPAPYSRDPSKVVFAKVTAERVE
jgi:hypothetical protein